MVLASARASIVLPVPGEVLEQQVALGDQAGERQPDDVALAEHGLLDVAGHRARSVPRTSDVRRSTPWQARPCARPILGSPASGPARTAVRGLPPLGML